MRERLASGVWDTPLLLQFLCYPPVVAALEPPAKKQAPKPQTTRMLSQHSKVAGGDQSREALTQLVAEVKQVLQAFRRSAAIEPLESIRAALKQCPPGQAVPNAASLLAQCETIFVAEISGALLCDMPIQQTLPPAIQTMLGDKQFVQVSSTNLYSFFFERCFVIDFLSLLFSLAFFLSLHAEEQCFL